MDNVVRSFCVVLCSFLFAAGCEASAPQVVAEPKALSTTADDPGLRAYIDPDTGEFVPAPPGKRPSPNPRDTHDGLREVPSPVEGGGVMVDMEGRFLNHSTGESPSGAEEK